MRKRVATRWWAFIQMFNPRARISSKAIHDRLLRDRAIEEGRALFKSMGEDGIHVTSRELLDPSRDADERRHARLMILEMERLYRIQCHGQPSYQLVIWKPPLFSMARLRAYFGVQRKRRRRR